MFGGIPFGAGAWGINSLNNGPWVAEASAIAAIDVLVLPKVTGVASAAGLATATIEIWPDADARRFAAGTAAAVLRFDVAPSTDAVIAAVGLAEIEVHVVTDSAELAGASKGVADIGVDVVGRGGAFMDATAIVEAGAEVLARSTSVRSARGSAVQAVDVFGESQAVAAARGLADVTLTVLGISARIVAVVLPENPTDAQTLRLGNYLYAWDSLAGRWKAMGRAP